MDVQIEHRELSAVVYSKALRDSPPTEPGLRSFKTLHNLASPPASSLASSFLHTAVL